jgi:hypothetical protein
MIERTVTGLAMTTTARQYLFECPPGLYGWTLLLLYESPQKGTTILSKRPYELRLGL